MRSEQQEEMPADDKLTQQVTSGDAERNIRRSLKKRKGISDSFVKRLFGIAALVVIGALLTAIFAIWNGIIDFGVDVPRTLSEFRETKAGAELGVEETAEAYGRLAISQIDNGKFTEAKQTIAVGRDRQFDDEDQNHYLDFAEAYMAQVQGNTQLAIELYTSTMAALKASYEKMLNSTITPNWATAYGIHQNYYYSALGLADLYGIEGNLEKQLEYLNLFLENSSATGVPADILIDRGEVKLALGDTEGAIADFNEALKYLPNDERALEGLKKAEGN